ncbi:MAG: hypothetical protein ACI88H_001158 [Cocleimonas sp.]|jgi:hypothetical protein
MSRNVRYLKLCCALLLTLVLYSCGGGGSDSDDGGGGTTPSSANVAPTANAGLDQTVDENTLVTLTGSGSDSDGSITSYSWVQTSGENAAIENGSSAETLISIPSVDSDLTLTFELTVTDNDGATHSDSIDIQVTYLNDIIVLNENETSAITSQSQTSFQVDENSELSNKKVGDIVIADVSDDLPNGLFVKITEKSNANGITTFATEQPGLKEVIKEGELSISKTFEPSDFTSMTTSPTPVGMKLYVKNDNFTYSGLTQQAGLQSKKKSEFSNFQAVKQLRSEISWDADIFQGCNNSNKMQSSPSVVIVLENVGLYQNINNANEEPIFDTGALGLYENDAYVKIVSVDGCLGMNFGYDFVLDFNLFTSDHYLFTVNPEQYGELKIAGKLAEAKLELKRELHKWILPKIKVLVGVPPLVVPVWITPEITIMLGLDATAGANIFTGVSEYAGVEFGIEYKNNELSPIVESDFEFNYQPPTLALEAEVESYIGPNLALKIYDIVGPNADLQLYANALVQNDDPWWKLVVGARAGAGIKVEVLDKEIEKLSFRISGIIDEEINSWQAQSPFPNIPVNVDTTSSYTTEAGYKVNFRYIARSDWDLERPRGVYVYLHGNNSVTSDVLHSLSPEMQDYLLEQGYIITIIEAPWDNGSERGWEDPKGGADTGVDMLNSLLSSDFGDSFFVDNSDILIEGGSAGTCLANRFIQKYYGNFKGGVYANCGCTALPDDSRIAPLVNRDSWRFYVENNKGDFLFETGRSLYGYFKYTLQFETEGNFNKEGGHCSTNTSGRLEALDWLISGDEATETEFEPHFSFVTDFENMNAIAIDEKLNIWVAEQSDEFTLKIYKGDNLGRSWSLMKTLKLIGSQHTGDMVYFKGHLYLDLNDGNLYQFDTVNFSQQLFSLPPSPTISFRNFYVRSLSTDHQTTLYYRGIDSWKSTNGGATWQQVSIDDSEALVYIPELLSARASVLSDNDQKLGSIAFDGDNAWATVEKSANGVISEFKLYQSKDFGKNWNDVTPAKFNNDGTNWFNTVPPLFIKYLLDGSLLITKGTHSWVSIDKGRNWTRTYGSSTDKTTGNNTLMTAETPDGFHTIMGFFHYKGLYYLEK